MTWLIPIIIGSCIILGLIASIITMTLMLVEELKDMDNHKEKE